MIPTKGQQYRHPLLGFCIWHKISILLNSSSISSFLHMAVGGIPFNLPFHLTNIPSKKRGSSGRLFHLKDRKPGGKLSSCQFCLYKIVKVCILLLLQAEWHPLNFMYTCIPGCEQPTLYPNPLQGIS